jgi:hypothetical protein
MRERHRLQGFGGRRRVLGSSRHCLVAENAASECNVVPDKARSGPPLPTTLGCYELRPTALGHAVTELPDHLVINPGPPLSVGQGAALAPL